MSFDLVIVDTAPAACCTKPLSAGSNANIISYANQAATSVNTATHVTVRAFHVLFVNVNVFIFVRLYVVVSISEDN